METTNGNKSKSFQNLLVTTYNSKTGDGQTNAATLPQNFPLSFLRSGHYYYSNGALNNRGTYGNYWSLRGNSDTNASYLYFSSTYVYPQDGDNRGHGFAIRCLAR